MQTTITTNQEYTFAVNLCKYHNHLYFVKHAPVISDASFDEMYFAIQQYELEHPYEILPDSPTQRAGTDGTEGSHTVPHRVPMLSTQKVKTIEDVQKWMKQTTAKCGAKQYTLEWKYDGVSCSLVYMNGVLIEASTRGDTKKQMGQDIFNVVMEIPSIPKELPNMQSSRFEVRGEIMMPFDAMDDEDIAKLYGDPRTAASAIVNTTTDVSPHAEKLIFKPWDCIWGNIDFKNHSQLSSVLAPRFFDIDHKPALVHINSVEVWIEAMTDRRASLPYPTDGLVIKVDDKRLWDGLGRTEHHPKYLLAYKFPPLSAETTCTKIEYTTGEKTGKITPIAYFDPVTLNGKSFCKASLGSVKCMEDLGIKAGSRIEVCLANDVIPHVNCVID